MILESHAFIFLLLHAFPIHFQLILFNVLSLIFVLVFKLFEVQGLQLFHYVYFLNNRWIRGLKTSGSTIFESLAFILSFVGKLVIQVSLKIDAVVLQVSNPRNIWKTLRLSTCSSIIFS